MSEKNSSEAHASPGVFRGYALSSRVLRPEEAGPVVVHVDGYLERGGTTIVVGWAFDPENRVTGFVRLVPADSSLEQRYAVYSLDGDRDKVQIDRVARLDVAQAMGVENDLESRHGFVLKIRGKLGDGRLALALSSGQYVVVPAEYESGQPNEAQALEWQKRGFQAFVRSLPTLVEDPARGFAAVERAYPLGEAGLLVLGWMFFPHEAPKTVTVHGATMAGLPIDRAMYRLIREDVVKAYEGRFPENAKRSGFVCRVPLPTKSGEPRALCLDFGERGEVWLKLPTDRALIPALDQIKEILGFVPSPGLMRQELYTLFDSGLGEAIEAINGAHPRFEGDVSAREFGTQVSTPRISIVVPLYGRFDFLRHQLAQFVDDPDFVMVELIYVIDDPDILAQTLELAANCHALFGLPFKVVWSGQNLGFSGANNVGVRLAQGDLVVLLNSDVIPQQPGWLTTLSSALGELTDAGAVAPLLQYGDGSIQHAGMVPKQNPSLPGFVLNAHPGKGQVWHGQEQPSEHSLLTGACLMMRKHDYLSVGGLDEGYVIGDFEDSDLCLALRKRNRRLYLVPRARLWHLERQSQGLEKIASYRQLLTLFNGWRYRKRILQGLIADPYSPRLTTCVF